MFFKKNSVKSTATDAELLAATAIVPRRPSLLYSICSVVVALTLIISSAVSGLYAKFAAKTDAGDGSRVAVYELDINNTDNNSLTLDLSYITYPGTSQNDEYLIHFSVTNGNSEVAQRYRLVASDMGNLPIQYKLTSRLGGGIGTPASIWEGNGTTVDGEFPANQTGTHNFIIRIHWTQAEAWQKDYKLSEEIEYVTLTAVAEQID